MASKESLSILVQLVNIAQKRGAFTIEESYLAFMAMKEFIDDPKLVRAEELVNQLFNKNPSKKTELSSIENVVNNLNDDNL
tara:strand:- start:156 stop:398 length:243 start_codon:yes stop_codon:yes gene_type:complete